MKDTWKTITSDPEDPNLRKTFERAADHILREAQQIYTQLDYWLCAQERITEKEVEIIEQIDELSEKIVGTLFGGVVSSRNFGAISQDSDLIRGTHAQELMRKNGWRVLDIQGHLYQMDKKKLQQLAFAIIEAADQGKDEVDHYRIQRENRGLLAFKKEEPIS